MTTRTLEGQRADALLTQFEVLSHQAASNERAATGALAQGDTVVAEMLRAEAWAKRELASAARERILAMVTGTEKTR